MVRLFNHHQRKYKIMNIYSIHYAYSSSDKAKELGFEKDGVAYLEKVKHDEMQESVFHNLEGKVIKTAKTVEELVKHAADKKLPLHPYSLGI